MQVSEKNEKQTSKKNKEKKYLGDGLGSLTDGMLGKFTREHEIYSVEATVLMRPVEAHGLPMMAYRKHRCSLNNKID